MSRAVEAASTAIDLLVDLAALVDEAAGGDPEIRAAWAHLLGRLRAVRDREADRG
ncbi:MAG: hypothetical protein ACHQWU_12215 [Gemmatimonadales bacterium]